MDKNFAIIDLETTGGAAKREKIIEIAIVIFDGKKIVDSFESLIHPERSIPHYITRITGITNEMVINAPKFYEVAKKVVEITQDCIFVAHNVRFDYSFTLEEFNRLGFTYSRQQLCTIKLFRQFFPGLKSYSLGNLIKHFEIDFESRHRAMADVIATLDILKIGLKQSSSENILNKSFGIIIKETKLPNGINITDITNLPSKTGVYYFLDMYDNIVYIGKSINIKKRVKQHFQKITPKSNKFYNTVRKINYKITGSELIAFLIEAEEIKKHKPPINKALRKDDFPYSVYYQKDEIGYYTFKISKVNNTSNKSIFLTNFTSRKASKSFIENTIINYNLCKNISGINKYDGACFEHGLGLCFGACIQEESPEEYNNRVSKAIDQNRFFENNTFILIEEGRIEDETSIVFIENNNYKGFAFCDMQETTINSIQEVHNIITQKEYDKDFNTIIKRYINRGKRNIKVLK